MVKHNRNKKILKYTTVFTVTYMLLPVFFENLFIVSASDILIYLFFISYQRRKLVPFGSEEEEEEPKIENPIWRIDKYILIDSIWHKKTKVFESRRPFKTLLYQELLDFENENFEESELIECDKDDNFLPMYRLQW